MLRNLISRAAAFQRRMPIESFRYRKHGNPEDLYVFLSYTSRESEVQLVQPLIDQYCLGLWEWADSNGIHVFYDHFSLPRKPFHDSQLAGELADAIKKSDLMTAFLSPGYINSEWCQFDWTTQYARVRAVCFSSARSGVTLAAIAAIMVSIVRSTA